MTKKRASRRQRDPLAASPHDAFAYRAAWLSTAALAGLVFLAYLPALSVGFIWDDDSYVTRNPMLVSPGGLWRIWFEPGATVQYYPLVFTTFWIEHQLWGFSPPGYHLVNLLLHACSAVVFWRVLHRLGVPAAWIGAVIFAVHPVHVESVAWVTERKNVLSMVFFLLSARAYLRYTKLGLIADDSPKASHPRAYAEAIVLFIAALLSKTTTVVLPVALMMLTWWKSGRIRRRDVLRLGPFFALALIAGMITSRVESHHVGAGELEWTLSWPQRFMLAGRSLVFYLSKLAWPTNLSFIYDRWTIDAGRLAGYSYLLAAAGLGVLLWTLRGRIGRGPATAYAYYVICLLPALGFVKFWFMNYSFVADHFQYLASLGPIALAAAGLARFAGSVQKFAAGRLFVAWRAATVVLLITLVVLTWRRAAVFHDLESLWFDVMAKSETARPMAHENLAVHYASVGRFADSVTHYRSALRFKPDAAELHCNLAVSLYQLGRKDEAQQSWHEAVRLRPAYPEAWNNLGLIAADRGDHHEALRCYQEALRHAPQYADGYFNLARALVKLGRPTEAMEAYRQVLRINPADVEAARELANLQVSEGG